MTLLDPVYMLAALLTAPAWARKARGDWPARFGKIEQLPDPAPGRKRLLLHAVSVGEVNALRALVPMLTAEVEVVISVGTDTGIARARELFESGTAAERARCAVVRYPLDFSWSVRRFLDAVRPDAVGLVELELWPQFVRECRRRAVPVAVINGRLSERSFRGYKRWRRLLRRMFGSLEFAAVQDEAYAERFRAMGVPVDRVKVTGSMKWDSATIGDAVAGADGLATELGIDRQRPLVVGGSTGPLEGKTGEEAQGEEDLLHQACLAAGDVQLLCAPRRPERFDKAAAAMPGCVRRSARSPGEPGCTRFLLDTIGELRAAYALADVVVMGRSFGDLYGSDPVEPVALGRAVVIGPRYGDFQSSVDALASMGGIVKTTAAELSGTLRALLADPTRRRELAERGRACIREQQGATRRHADILLALLESGVHVTTTARPSAAEAVTA